MEDHKPIVALPYGYTEPQHFSLRDEIIGVDEDAKQLLQFANRKMRIVGVRGEGGLEPLPYDEKHIDVSVRFAASAMSNSGLVLWEAKYLDMALNSYYGLSSSLLLSDLPTRATYHKVRNGEELAFRWHPFEKNPFFLKAVITKISPDKQLAFVALVGEDFNQSPVLYPNGCEVGDDRFSSRVLWSMTRFMRERVDSEILVVPKKMHRSLKHVAIPEVRRITLRTVVPQEPTPKEVTGSNDSRPIEWSCQWTVKGHWRNQYYPSTGEHKLIFVAEYRKGPEDKPLRETPTIVEVKR